VGDGRLGYHARAVPPEVFAWMQAASASQEHLHLELPLTDPAAYVVY
jgi:hypothetical protein